MPHTPRYKPHERPGLSDTSPEAQAVLDDIYRHMSPERKLEIVFEMYAVGRQLHAAGVRYRQPDATDDEVLTEWFRATLEPDLFQAVEEQRARLRDRS